MAELLRDMIEAPTGYRSREVALFVAQMDDQRKRMLDDLRGIDAAELEWQPALGMNTIGMLLAHIAVVEAFWVQIGLLEVPFSCVEILGVRSEDDGMPLPEDARPPSGLAGKDLAFFLDLLGRARAHTKEKTAGLADPDLDTIVRRARARGPSQEFNKRWVLYHLLEHEAGHYGQILLLRHQVRSAGRG